MAKNKKKIISDVKCSKSSKKKSMNPFEIRINREKFKVIGKKSKFDKGLPGVARAKAIKKRKETLLQEYKVLDKSNRFIDRRIGERNKAMTNEDKIIARFTAERMKTHRRKAMFNLAEEEVLTHKGRSIIEVERFDNPRSDDEDDEIGTSGNLDANFVEEAHFGGGMFTKSKNNRESVIDQLIADSKKRKFERQQTKERTLELTEKLDTEWRDLIPLINSNSRNDDEPKGKRRPDPYDLALQELKFEARGKPTDKLKSEEEIAEEEAKKLQKLEEERLRRMRGEDTQVTVSKRQHKSADALDMNFELDDEDDFSLMYDDKGNLLQQPKDDVSDDDDIEEPRIIKTNPDDVDVSEEEDDDDGSEGEEEEDSIDEDEMIQDLKTELQSCDNKLEEEEEEQSDNECTDDAKIDTDETIKTKSDETVAITEETGESAKENKPEDDDYLKSLLQKYSIDESTDESVFKRPKMLVLTTVGRKTKTSESTDDLNSKVCKSDSPKKGEKITKKVCFDNQVEEVKFGENSTSVKSLKTAEEIREDLIRRKELMDKARSELPYTYEAPGTYEELQDYFKGHNHNEIIVIVERIIKCNHPRLREENKMKMTSLFAFLMQYLNDLDHKNCWVMLDRLAPFLYDLTMFSPSNAAECIVEVLKEKQSDYAEKKYKYPGCSTLVFLKLIPMLFPASDKRHPVTTPALVFLTQLLQNCRVSSRRSIASGLFIVSLMYEYLHLSKRISPQAINFIVGILHLASSSDVKPSVAPPFKEEHKLLYLHQSFSKNIKNFKLSVAELSHKSPKIDDEFRVKSLYTALNLLDSFLELYDSHEAVSLLFIPVKNYLSSFQFHKYPNIFNESVKSIYEKLDKMNSKTLDKITAASKKPKALRLYEPIIEPVYDTKRRPKDESIEKAEHNKLIHKIKREKKGALREIRRDKTFIAKIKFKQQHQRDAERMRKVKQIYSWGAQQQGELNAFQRIKNKKR